MSIFQIDQQSRTPLYEQLKRQVLSLAASGVLEEDEKMPSVRQLASELGINPNTVQKAYRELEREGLIYTVPGRGSFLTATDTHVNHLFEVWETHMEQIIRSAIRSGFTRSDLERIFTNVLDRLYAGAAGTDAAVGGADNGALLASERSEAKNV